MRWRSSASRSLSSGSITITWGSIDSRWALTSQRSSNSSLGKTSAPGPITSGDCGRDILDEDLARLSPLQHEHTTMLGTFQFALPAELDAGQRRALRTSTTDGL